MQISVQSIAVRARGISNR